MSVVDMKGKLMEPPEMHDNQAAAEKFMEQMAELADTWRKSLILNPQAFLHARPKDANGRPGCMRHIIRRMKADLEFIERSIP